MKSDNTQRINQVIARNNGGEIKEASSGGSGGGNSRPGKPTPQKDRQPQRNDESNEPKGAGKQSDDGRGADVARYPSSVEH